MLELMSASLANAAEDGWHDLALRSREMHGGTPQATSWNANGTAQKSFLLGNDLVPKSLIQCATSKHYS